MKETKSYYKPGMVNGDIIVRLEKQLHDITVERDKLKAFNQQNTSDLLDFRRICTQLQERVKFLENDNKTLSDRWDKLIVEVEKWGQEAASVENATLDEAGKSYWRGQEYAFREIFSLLKPKE